MSKKKNLLSRLALAVSSLAFAAPAAHAAGGYADAVLADGPIAYYRFSDTVPTAVNSGTLGAAANGTYNGAAAPGSLAPQPPDFVGFEASNTAVQLDGTSAFVSTISGLLNGRPVFTISGWYRRAANQNDRTGLFGQNDLMEVGYINNNTLEIWTDNGLDISPNPTPNGEWAHIAAVSTGSPGTMTMYTNGVIAGVRNHSLPADNAFAFNIGGGGVFDGTGNFFNGQMDEIAVFDKALDAGQIAAQYAAARTPISPLASFANVGNNPIGSSSYNSATGALTIVGGGNDIWDQLDNFSYAYQPQVGDFDVKVRVESLEPNARWSKAGIMVRENLGEDSRMLFLRVAPADVATLNGGNGANDTKLSYRTGAPDTAGETDGNHEDPADQNIPPYPNAWLRLVRSGSVFTAHISSDNVTWTAIASQDTAAGNWLLGGGSAFREDALIGLAVCRHSGGPTATAVFKEFSFTEVPFTLVQGSSRGNPNAVLLTFSSKPDEGTLNIGNIDIPGIALTSITPGPRANTYWANVDASTPLVEGTSYTLDCFGVTAGGGTVSLAVQTDAFTHGAGFENVGVHVGHNKEPDFGLVPHEGRTHTARGLFSTAEGSPALESNGFFEDPLVDNGTNERFTSTIFGILNVTTAGNYQFACSSDDYGKLYIGSNDDPATKRLIAREPEWNGSRQYAVGDRRPLQADLPQNTVRPNLTPSITLAAGQYYLEYVFNEGGGGNNGSVTWAPFGTLIDNNRTPITAAEMAPSRYFNGSERGELFRNLGNVAIVGQPASQTVIAGNPVSFRVRLDGTPAYTYQWRRNGRAIQGATGPVYTIPVALPADDGAVYTCAVANEFSTAVSAAATLTVNVPTPPVLLSGTPDGTLRTVTLTFDKRVEPASALNLANYSIPGLTVAGATLDASGRVVKLTTSTMAEGTAYTLSVSNVKEVTGNNALTPNPTVVNFTSYVYAAGYAQKDYYLGFTAGVDAIAAAQPAASQSCLIKLWELNEVDEFENYAAKISGYFVATETGPHVFFLASDDGGRLFMSTDENPANKVEIAREPVWSGRRTWTGEAGGGGRVGVASASGGPQANTSGAMNLVAGQRYYMESFVQEGGGGDNLGVAVRLPSDVADPDNATSRGIGAKNLGIMIPATGISLAIATEPSDITVPANAFATFTVGATGGSPFCGGGLSYQWYVNGAAIAGANGASLTVGPLAETQNGEKYSVVVSVPSRSATSREAVLTVTPPAPLKVVGASGSANLRDVVITFDQVVEAGSATDLFNYTSPDLGSVEQVTVNPGGVSVTVRFANAQTPGAVHTVNVQNVSSGAGTGMDPASVDVSFTAYVFATGVLNLSIWENIGTVNVSALTGDPRYPSNPTRRYYIGAFDTRLALPTDALENYGGRIDGFFVPPTSGNWILYLRSDDASELWMDLNDGAGMVKVQEDTGCCGAFSAHPTAPLALVGGQRYAIMGLYKEAGGGDYLQVAAKLESDPTDPNTLRPVGGTSVGTYVSGAGVSLTATTQPADQTFLIDPTGAGPTTVTFNFAATAVVPGDANPPVIYQWSRDGAQIPGANGPSYTFAPVLADNGATFSCAAYTIGASVVSRTATLTVAQPNTAPSFACGPNQGVAEDAGAQTVAGWATDIKNHSIARIPVTYANNFGAGAAGMQLFGVAAVDGGALKLTGPATSQYGAAGITASLNRYESLDVSWKSYVGDGAGGGADGYSLNIGSDVPADPGYGGEEGIGTGLTVTVDTFDNGTGADVGVDIKWNGARVAYVNIPKDNDGVSPTYLRKSAFVDAHLTLDAAGLATMTYDGQTISANITGYAGLLANRALFWGRTGGASDNQWVDDFSFAGFPIDASSVEAAQTVQFLVSNDNPSLFSAQPAIAPDGTLTYTAAANASGVASVTVRAQDNGGTAFGGRDTSAACTFTITVNGVCDAPVANNDSGTTIGSAPLTINVLANDTDIEGGLAITSVTQGANGSVAVSGGSVVYTANAGFEGVDTFTYTIGNACQGAARATVTVTVLPDNRPPTAKITTDALVDFTPDFEHPVLISCNWWNACLILDGSLSSDPDGGALSYLWFVEPSPVPFAAGPVATNCLEVGTHTIILTVTDNKGASDSDSLTIEEITAPLAIELLMEKVNESRVTRAIKRELLAVLRTALNQSKNEKIRPTQTTLDAFEKKVRAKVTAGYPTEAAAWIRWSQAISSGMEKCIKAPVVKKDYSDDKDDKHPRK